MHNGKIPAHPYAPEAAIPAVTTTTTTPGGVGLSSLTAEVGHAEKALDCVSDSSGSSSSSTSSSSCSSSSASPSSCSFSSASSHGRAAAARGATHSTGGGGDGPPPRPRRMQESQGLWASGGSLCGPTQQQQQPSPPEQSDGIVVRTTPLVGAAGPSSSSSSLSPFAARGESSFFRGSLAELSPAARVAAATYYDPAAHTAVDGSSSPPAVSPPKTSHPSAAATATATTALPRGASFTGGSGSRQAGDNSPRGRQHTPSPLPPLPRTSSGDVPHHLSTSPAAAAVTASVSAATTHPYAGIATSALFDTAGSTSGGGATTPRPHRPPSVSSNRSHSGPSTPVVGPKPPRPASEERGAGMPAMWVDIPPSPMAAYVQPHSEPSQQRRRTPRRSSAPPSPNTSTLAASLGSSTGGGGGGTAGPLHPHPYQHAYFTSSGGGGGFTSDGSSAREAGDTGCSGGGGGGIVLSMPPPLAERVPCTSPTASVSSASAEVSPTSVLFTNDGGDAANLGGGGGGANLLPAPQFPNRPSGATTRHNNDRNSNTRASPISPGSYTATSIRVDFPPAATALVLSASTTGRNSPTVVAAAADSSSGDSARGSGRHCLDPSPHTRVALPPSASVGHRPLFSSSRPGSAGASSASIDATAAAATATAASYDVAATAAGGRPPGRRASATAAAPSPSSSSSFPAAVNVAPPPPHVEPGLPMSCLSQTSPSRSTAHRTTTITVHAAAAATLANDNRSTTNNVASPTTGRQVSDEPLVVVSPCSPVPRLQHQHHQHHHHQHQQHQQQQQAVTPTAREDDLVSSASDSRDDVLSDVSSGGGAAAFPTMDRIMDAVKRAKERAAKPA